MDSNFIVELLEEMSERLPHTKNTQPCFFSKLYFPNSASEPREEYIYNVVNMLIKTNDENFNITNSLQDEVFADKTPKECVTIIIQQSIDSGLYTKEQANMLRLCLT